MQLNQKIKPAPKEEVSYGHLNLNSATHSFIKDCKIGEEKEITIKIKVKGLREPDRWEVSEKKMKPTDVIASVNIIDISHKSSDKKEKE